MDDPKRPEPKGKKSERKKKRWWLLLPAFLLVLGGAVILLLNLKVKIISVEGETRYLPDMILESSGIREGDRMFGLDEEKAEREILSRCPYLCEIAVSREWPSTVRIRVKETESAFKTEIGGEMWLISKDLIVLERVPEGGEDRTTVLCLLEIREAVAGQKIVFEKDPDGNLRETILELIRIMEEETFGKEHEIRKAHFEDLSSLVLICDGKYRLLMGQSGDFRTKLRTAGKVLEDDVFATGSRALIDLTKTSMTSVTLDAEVDLD